MRSILLSAILLLIISQSFGQFTLKGEFRPRFEYRNGYSELLSKDEKPVLTASQRTRLTANYQNGIFTFGLGIQDAMVWGDDHSSNYTGTPTSTPTIELNEGWIGLKPYTGGLFKMGRQYWIYEDERLLSSRSWNQSEIKYDALFYQHQDKAIQVDVGLSWNNAKEKASGNEYDSTQMKTLNFIYLKKNINDWMYVSALAVASGFTKSPKSERLNMQGSYGLYFVVKKDKLNVLANGYYQNGRNRVGMKTSAFLLSAKVDYTFAGKFTIGGTMDYISGTSQQNNDPDYAIKNHSFDNLYGVRHRILGHMDLFNNIPKATWNGGIQDYYLTVNYAFADKKASAGADIHYFSLQNDVLDKTAGDEDVFLKKGLGSEIDAYLSWNIVKFVSIRGGYSTFIATDSMEKLQGVYGNARFPSWVWVMIVARPVFLDTAAK